jgi:hypothetical protein
MKAAAPVAEAQGQEEVRKHFNKIFLINQRIFVLINISLPLFPVQMVRPTPCFPHFPSSLALWHSLRRH